MISRVGAIVVGICVSWTTLVKSESMAIPIDIQSAVFTKIFSYDKNLKGVGQIEVFIVGAEKEDQTAHDLAEAFRQVGASPAVVGSAPLEGLLSPNAVVYLLPEADFSEMKRLCGESSVLTISGVPSLVEQGHASVGLGEKDGKTEIIVNLPRLKEEGHELSAQLLKLARVIH